MGSPDRAQDRRGRHWSQIATAPANAAGYADTGLVAATSYVYRVRATNGAGASPNSNEASATTLDQAALPRAPLASPTA